MLCMRACSRWCCGFVACMRVADGKARPDATLRSRAARQQQAAQLSSASGLWTSPFLSFPSNSDARHGLACATSSRMVRRSTLVWAKRCRQGRGVFLLYDSSLLFQVFNNRQHVGLGKALRLVGQGPGSRGAGRISVVGGGSGRAGPPVGAQARCAALRCAAQQAWMPCKALARPDGRRGARQPQLPQPRRPWPRPAGAGRHSEQGRPVACSTRAARPPGCAAPRWR